MILYTDDDIPIIYNPIQLQDENKIIEDDNKKIIEIPEKNIVNKIICFMYNYCCCFRNK